MIALIVGATLVALVLIVVGAWLIWVGVERWRERRRTRLEAELARTRAELRMAAYRLAAALNQDASEAQKALLQAAYLATRRLPPQ